MTKKLTQFEEGKHYYNRIGIYKVLKIYGDGTMDVYCGYDCEERNFNILHAQLTIFNMKRGK